MRNQDAARASQARRSFLKQAAVAGSGVAFIAATRQTSAMTLQPADAVQPEVGYRVTDHVSAYYRSARS